MTPVFPYLIRRSADGWRGELLLRLRNGKSAYVVHITLEQARMLAVEMRGLASDHCPLHHMSVRLAESLNAKISHIVIKRVGPRDEVAGMIRMVTPTGLHSANADAAAALALAIHMGLPVFMDGEFAPAEPEGDGQRHDALGVNAPPGELPAELIELPRESPTPIPPAFQELIEGLKMPEGTEGSDSRPDDGD